VAIRNLSTMSDATLAARMVEAKREVNAAERIMEEIASQIRSREEFSTVEVGADKVTRSPARQNGLAFDVETAKTLIPDWETRCSKPGSFVKASVRVTFG
jgi:hypothetical protein